MERVVIEGGHRLTGRVRVSGSKYAALAALPAALLAGSPSVLENVPDITDVRSYLDILSRLGAGVERPEPGVVRIDPRGLAGHAVPYQLARAMRASYYLLPVLAARIGRAEIALPGGDDIGPRPIDQHIKGFRAMGMEIVLEHGAIRGCPGPSGLRGASIYLDVVSVGATINLILGAVVAEGTTTLINCDRGPYVVDVANFLNQMGARVQGAGTDTIRIIGVGRRRSLSGCRHALIPDQSEAATLMSATAATGGDVRLEGIIPGHVEAMTIKLREAGAIIDEGEDWLRVRSPHRLRGVQVKTQPYPGFFTDFQPPLTALLTTAEGTSVVVETVWPGRLKYIDELRAMGADVQVANQTAVIRGVAGLGGARVTAGDLRAGAALVIAGLMAEGRTEVRGIDHADRGYERLDEKLRRLGAEIKRVGASPPPDGGWRSDDEGMGSG